MASGGRRGAGERVLEGKHVIGLFLLMLLFSGVFFTLGYVMGRNQYAGQVSASTPNSRTSEPVYLPKSEPAPKKTVEVPVSDRGSDSTSEDKSAWESWKVATSAKPEPRLDEAPKPSATAQPAPKTVSPKANLEQASPAVKSVKPTVNAPLIPYGTFLLQVAALNKQDDALAVASSLQKKHFAAYVVPPQKDKLFRVQVGPLKDQKSADDVRKGLESAGFKAFYVKH